MNEINEFYKRAKVSLDKNPDSATYCNLNDRYLAKRWGSHGQSVLICELKTVFADSIIYISEDEITRLGDNYVDNLDDCLYCKKNTGDK